MARDFKFSVVAPDRSVIEDSALSVIAPGIAGYFGVLAGHVPVVAALKPGLIEYVDAHNARHYVYIGGGFAEVAPDKVTVLADEAALSNEIDLADTEKRLELARKVLRGEDNSMTRDAAVTEIDRAMGRIRASRLHR